MFLLYHKTAAPYDSMYQVWRVHGAVSRHRYIVRWSYIIVHLRWIQLPPSGLEGWPRVSQSLAIWTKECNNTRAPENALVCEILFQLLISEIVSLNFNDLRKGSPMFDMDKLLLSLVAVQVDYMLSLWGNNDDTFGKEDSSSTINGISVA